VYDRQGEEVVGYFAGNLRGNVLQFHWQEPSNPPLTGEGFLVFDGQGRQYSGRWWSDRRERVGDWSGWRQPPQVGADPRGRGDGNAPVQRRQPSLYQRSPYQQPYPQQQPYQQQPAPGQPAPQPQQQPAQPAQQPGYSET
jgi:hypothetical protein